MGSWHIIKWTIVLTVVMYRFCTLSLACQQLPENTTTKNPAEKEEDKKGKEKKKRKRKKRKRRSFFFLQIRGTGTVTGSGVAQPPQRFRSTPPDGSVRAYATRHTHFPTPTLARSTAEPALDVQKAEVGGRQMLAQHRTTRELACCWGARTVSQRCVDHPRAQHRSRVHAVRR